MSWAGTPQNEKPGQAGAPPLPVAEGELHAASTRLFMKGDALDREIRDRGLDCFGIVVGGRLSLCGLAAVPHGS
jgi:hypothetical protein